MWLKPSHYIELELMHNVLHRLHLVPKLTDNISDSLRDSFRFLSTDDEELFVSTKKNLLAVFRRQEK